MEQTNTYKLNLIHKNDVFSPDPLNENTQKLEDALQKETAARQKALQDQNAAQQKALQDEIAARKSAVQAEEAARKSAVSALDQRLQTFEIHKVASGTYKSKENQFISVGFTPKIVILQPLGSSDSTQILTTYDLSYKTFRAQIMEGGFYLNQTENNIYNYRGFVYWYLALA